MKVFAITHSSNVPKLYPSSVRRIALRISELNLGSTISLQTTFLPTLRDKGVKHAQVDLSENTPISVCEWLTDKPRPSLK